MSAYALPGLFPFPSPAASESDEKDASSNGPLHQEERPSSSLTGILKAGVDRFCPPLLSKKDGSKEGEEMPGIQVREAKIDPVRLVQYLTQTQTQQSRKNQLRRRNSKERLSEPLARAPPGKCQAEEKSISVGSPHDEAIEFELSISFNGRKYNATRTMQCIVQLRDDLISERRWLQMRASKGPFGASDVDVIQVQIPEIPPMDDNGPAAGSGFVGRGFSMLHAMVTSYVPAMERWLRNVMDVVPQDSECLMNFLWEPLATEMPPLKSCASSATLGSIKELDYKTDDSDSEDEWG